MTKVYTIYTKYHQPTYNDICTFQTHFIKKIPIKIICKRFFKSNIYKIFISITYPEFLNGLFISF